MATQQQTPHKAAVRAFQVVLHKICALPRQQKEQALKLLFRNLSSKPNRGFTLFHRTVMAMCSPATRGGATQRLFRVLVRAVGAQPSTILATLDRAGKLKSLLSA